MTEKSSKSNNCVVCKKSGMKYSSPSTSLHSFPSCPEKRQIWINRCGLTDQEVLPYDKLCSFHFEPTCFKSKLKRRLLHRDALPTIFVKNHVKKTIMPIKKNKGKPINCNTNEIPLQNYNIRDVSVKVIDFLCFPPSDILLTRSAKEMIESSKCETFEIHIETLKEMNAILTNACNTQKKKDETAIMELRKQISSLKSQLEINENIIALYEAKIKKL